MQLLFLHDRGAGLVTSANVVLVNMDCLAAPTKGLSRGWGPDYDWQGRSGAMEQVICKTATIDWFGSGGACPPRTSSPTHTRYRPPEPAAGTITRARTHRPDALYLPNSPST